MPVRSVDLDHVDVSVHQVAGQAGAVGAGAFDADLVDRPEPTQPHDEVVVARSGGGELVGVQQGAPFVERSDNMDVAVSVDAARDSRRGFCHRGHCLTSIETDEGTHQPGRRTRQRWGF